MVLAVFKDLHHIGNEWRWCEFFCSAEFIQVWELSLCTTSVQVPLGSPQPSSVLCAPVLTVDCTLQRYAGNLQLPTSLTAIALHVEEAFASHRAAAPCQKCILRLARGPDPTHVNTSDATRCLLPLPENKMLLIACPKMRKGAKTGGAQLCGGCAGLWGAFHLHAGPYFKP